MQIHEALSLVDMWVTTSLFTTPPIASRHSPSFNSTFYNVTFSPVPKYKESHFQSSTIMMIAGTLLLVLAVVACAVFIMAILYRRR